MINERINELRQLMKKRQIDAYVVPTSDPHQSEYLADFYKTREYITGFTGSAGLAVITKNEAGLWTDGRYFIQAENELKNSEVKLFRTGNKGVPTYYEFINNVVQEYGKIGLDGNCFSYHEYKNLLDNIGNKVIISDIDYIGDIWEKRPKEPNSKAFVLDIKYAGETVSSKLNKIRKEMSSQGIDYTFIGSPEDICYLFNIRGNDIEYNPVLISYTLISKNKAILYISNEKIDKTVKSYLSKNKIELKEYEEIYEDIRNIPAKSKVYLDPQRTNVKIYNSFHNNIFIYKGINYTTKMKAVKNEVEIENFKKAYIKDGVALVKFFSWLETGIPTGTVTEFNAAEKLLEFRKEQENFIEPSFGTISAFGANASMPHYSASSKNYKTITNKGLYLCDSGGHYLEGTTDITRTIKVGELTEEEKTHYTYVLKSHISLISSKFLKGTKSSYLDAFARQCLWNQGFDFKHGTGHGVGYLLNVHEGPQRITNVNNDYAMEKGMTTSVEPGLYVDGSHGIRIESIVVAIDDIKTQFGEFLSFYNFTVVPIDTRPVIKDLLTEKEIKWLNDYNKRCYDELCPYLEGSDLQYLIKQTEAI